MIDQYHMRRQIHNAQQALRLLDLDPNKINWRQYAILMLYSSKADELKGRMLNENRGWFRHHSDYYATSLYLSPKGQPFYIGHGDHCDLVYGWMGLNQHELDMAGWLHISDGRVDCPVGVNPTQRAWLNANPPAGKSNWDIRDAEYPQRLRPYNDADKFDIRPSDDDERFYMRLFKEYAGPPIVTVSHGVMSCA